jgi:hypothetical protein
MKKLLIFVAILLYTIPSNAQEKILKAGLETRVDYTQEYLEGDVVGSNSGFKGRYLMFRLDGNITEGLSYSYRQRINRPSSNQSLFDSTDWLMLTYTTGHWGISAGKQIVAIGGYEYDCSPINLYFCSEYWNNIACYQLGISGSYSFAGDKDKLTLQICESPFRRGSFNPQNDNMLAYNLMWNGSHEWFKTIYSANMIEYAPGKFINYITLGNRFEFGDFAFELDLMKRASNADFLSMTDYSIIGQLSWRPIDQLNVFVKATYDRNKDVVGDLCVAPGTDLYRVGGGVEYFPIKSSRSLRLHLNCCYTDGESPTTTVLRPAQTIINGGVTWNVNFLNIKRK